MEFLLLSLSILFISVLLLGFKLLIEYIAKRARKDKPLPYRAKQYLFTRSEHEFLRVLHEQLDATRYLIFPKVRLADFIEVTVRGKEYQTWWNKIRSKHVDFLIWDMQQNKIALAIELDGRSHNSEKMRERDAFVGELYSQVGVELERVQVGSNFTQSISRIIYRL